MDTNYQNPTAGIGDPYWYEWTIGLSYVVDMLDNEKNIESVTLQSTDAQGLDDVVVVYSNKNSEYIQVKHTRTDDKITFGDALALLKSISSAWKIQKEKWHKCTPVLFSNRKISFNSGTKKSLNNQKYVSPALNSFLSHLYSELEKANQITDIVMPKEWSVAWNEWLNQLNELSNDDEKIQFLKLIEFKTDQPNLEELTKEVTQKIRDIFGISLEKATSVLSQLDNALRKWVTTYRGDKESIILEDIYELLSINAQELIGDHLLAPPTPFFSSRLKFLEDLSNHLLKGSQRVTFLTGLPGQGKTSVVSALANKRDPVIDLRYHAFKPITPQTVKLPADAGITTKAEVLWGDLLTEIRSFFFKGRLSKYKVPVRNDFLTLTQLISEVLRLANILGEERGRPTVIAIDGIDHAARAGIDQYSFLDTLIAPDAVPEHVRFLIVGQPAESYEKYPYWLKTESDKVAKWEVKGIEERDVSQLLTASALNLTADQFQPAVRLIRETAKGSTLSAIFAIEEAKSVFSVEDLQVKLINRNLASGISEYYETIWAAAVAFLDKKYAFVGLRLAACLSLIKERLTGNDLAEIFNNVMNISSLDWTEALRALRPLVIEETDGFRVTHNDVRVHLTKQVHSQPERLREVASLIADFYWQSPNKIVAKHASLFELLRKSDRHIDQARVFTPEYVMEGIALERPINELYNQCQQALLYASETLDWNCIHSISGAAATLVQLRKSEDWTDSSFRYVPEVAPLLISEGRVLNHESWTLDIVNNIIDDAYLLIRTNEKERAYYLMQRWFTNMTPIDLLVRLKSEVLDKDNNYVHLEDSFKQAIFKWGQISCYTGLQWTEVNQSYVTEDDSDKKVWAEFSSGLMKEAISYGDIRDWIRVREYSNNTYFKDMEDNLMQLAVERRWMEVTYTLKEYKQNTAKFPVSFRIKAAVLSLLTGRKDLHKDWVQPIEENGFEIFNESRSNSQIDTIELASLCCMVSFIVSWTNFSREHSGIVEEGIQTYYGKMRDDRKRAHLSVLLRSSSFIGRMLGVLKKRGRDVAEQNITPAEVVRLLEALVSKKRGYNESINTNSPITKWIVELILEFSSIIGGRVDRAVYEFMKQYSRSYPINYMMEISWRYLWDKGENEILECWFSHWCNDGGEVWKLELSERINIVNRICNLAKESGLHQVEESLQLLKWGMISYTGHKEYILENPQAWYKELSRIKPEIWKSQGKALLEISQVASELGDNRLSLFIDADVASSVAYEGATSMWRLVNAKNMIEPLLDNKNMIIDGLISVLENVDFSEKELLAIWCFGIGTLNWQSEYDRCYLNDLRYSLVYAAEKNSINSLADKLKYLAPAEFYIQSSSDSYRMPQRWYQTPKTYISNDDEAKKNFYKTLEDLPIEKAIEQLKQTNDMFFFKGIEIVIKRLKQDRPKGFQKYLLSLTNILLVYNHTSSQWSEWSGYNARSAYRAIIPLVNENIRFKLLKKVITNIDFDTDQQYWLSNAAESIDDFCRFRATATGVADLSAGLQRHLKLHETWIEGNGHLPKITRIELPDIEHLDSVPQSWGEFSIRYFFRVLQSDNLTRIELALRGIWALTQVVPSDLKYLSDNWYRLNLSAQSRLLLFIEKIAMNTNTSLVYEQFSHIILECYKGVNLELKLQAWVILKVIEYRTGKSIPEWELPISPENEILASLKQSNTGILDVPSISHGLVYELHGIDIVSSLIRRFEGAIGETAPDIEKKYASYSATHPYITESFEPLEIKQGQMGVRSLPQREYLFKIIYHELYTGRWKDVPLSRIAQALLKSDEPCILFESPSLVLDSDDWIIDNELDQMVGNDDAIIERFLPIIQADVSDDEVVLGAVLYTYSSSIDVEIVYNLVLRDKGFELDYPINYSTMSGRSFALYDDYRFDPQAINEPVVSMTYTSGGINEFLNQTLLCYPSLFWSQVLKWYPMANNPLIWMENDQPIVRFERFYGRIRNVYHGQLHRQPFLQRWICSKEAFEKIESALNVVTTSVKTVKIGRMKDN